MRGRVVGLALVIFVTLCGSCFAASTFISYDTQKAFDAFSLSHAKWNKDAGGITFDEKTAGKDGEDANIAVVESPEITTPKPFDQVVPSWNAYTPAGSYLTVSLKVRIDGTWTKWYKMMLYDTDGKPEAKKSFNDQNDALGRVGQDTLMLKKNADAVKIRVELASADGKVYPSLRYLAVDMSDPAKLTDDIPAVKSVWGKEIDVPYLCQLSVKGGSVWCSPTSVAMVLDYWSKQLNRPEMNVGITEAANNILDHGWGGTGNWSFNAAYAGSFKGMHAQIMRFTSVSQIEEWIAKGIPVIVSLDYRRLNRWKQGRVVGHLMVIRGFTKDGDPIFNDPWAYLDKGEKLRKVFKRADLEYAWLGNEGSRGTVYIIYPEDYKL